jgi:hypothetical protein
MNSQDVMANNYWMKPGKPQFFICPNMTGGTYGT